MPLSVFREQDPEAAGASGGSARPVECAGAREHSASGAGGVLARTAFGSWGSGPGVRAGVRAAEGSAHLSDRSGAAGTVAALREFSEGSSSGAGLGAAGGGVI